MNRPFGVPALAGPDRLKAGLQTSGITTDRFMVPMPVLDLATDCARFNREHRNKFQPGNGTAVWQQFVLRLFHDARDGCHPIWSA